MNRAVFLFIIFMSSQILYAQNVAGEWSGLLKIQGISLHIVFHISKTDTGYSSTMDSPDQGAKGIPVSSTSFSNSVLTIKINNAKIKFVGNFENDSLITGTFYQSGFSIPLELEKGKTKIQQHKKPQEPTKPFPYIEEDVTIPNEIDSLILSGTLTLPNKEGKFPAAILISGSGPQNRDEELLGHKPFLVLSDYLTRHGIAVLRFDDRGTGKSTGNFQTATTKDFSRDVESVFKYLETRKEIDKDRIGLIGHSEGGLIAPMVAVKNSKINFIVMLAGPGLPGYKLLLLQQEMIDKASGISDSELNKSKKINEEAFQIILESSNNDSIKIKLLNFIENSLTSLSENDIPNGMSKSDYAKLQVQQLTSPWMLFFLRYNPVPNLEKLNCHVLALNGEKDLQVPAKQNLAAIKSSLEKEGNKNFKTYALPNLNHLFQKCQTGLPTEYSEIDETFNKDAMEIISSWILSLKAQTKVNLSN